MSIVKMKRLRLLAIRSQREALLRELMLLGRVEVSDPAVTDDPEAAVLSFRPTGELSVHKSELAAFQTAITLLDKYAPAKKKLLEPRPEAELNRLLDDSAYPESLSAAALLDDTEGQMRAAAARESRQRGIIEALRPWAELDIPLDFPGTSRCAVLLGTAPLSADMANLCGELGAAAPEAQIFQVSAGKEQRCLCLICLREERDAALEALRGFGFSLSSLGNFRGTARENIRLAEKTLTELAEEKAALTERIAGYKDRRGEFELCADRAATKIAQAEAAEKLLSTESVIALEGWLSAPETEKLTEALARFDCAWDISDPDPEKPEEVPVKLKNGAFTRPFTMVTGMYSYPAYNGIDPNPFLFPTFALFFGIMFADIGYGLILILAWLLIHYKLKASGTFGYLGGIAGICGVSCVLFGAVTGTFFGDIIPQVAGFFGGSAVMPALIDPLKDPMTILIACIGIGVVHMLIGVTLNGYMLVRDGRVWDAVCDAGSVYLMFIGIALGALGVTWLVAIASVLFIIFAQGREAKTIGGKIGSGLYGLYSFASGWFGDILSYCRLMALMLAGTVIAQVFNTLGAMTGNIVAFVFIFLAGHALNFGLNIIGTYVHTSRLEYLEFFGKFYREGGRAFSPLEVKTNYYNICNN